MNDLKIISPVGWTDYELIDSGDGEKLERFGEFVLSRPDPQILWAKSLPISVWEQADAVFKKTYGDKGNWLKKRNLPEAWPMKWQDITTMAHLSPFKHTGVFPEQSAHWQWIKELIAEKKNADQSYQPNILNLFAYTGIASVVCAKAGAKVTHVDASRPSIGWAKQNQLASGLDERSIRWILDDVVKFVSREVKRGVKYDGIIMDPPIYGHGPTGEIWDFKVSFPRLLDLCTKILVPEPLFLVINAYAISISALTLGNMLEEKMSNYAGTIETGELILEQSNTQRPLSTGIFARYSKK